MFGLFDEFRLRAGAAVPAVRGEILRDEHDLSCPEPSISSRIEASGLERCFPRNDGIAQNPQRRSQPSATFT